MRILIVHNESAGKSSKALYNFQRCLMQCGDECVLRILDKCTDDYGMSTLADVDTFDCVVLSGGDGTVSSLLYGLRNKTVPVCVFPSGTANLIFANIGNSPKEQQLADACRQLNTKSADLGELTWHDNNGIAKVQGFSLMAGMGFDADIMTSAIPAKRIIGQAAYYTAVVKHLRPDVRRFKIVVDGEEHNHIGIACMVANCSMIQGKINLIPGCAMTDGLLDAMVLEVSRTSLLIKPLISGIVDHKGDRIGRPHITYYRGVNIRVESSSPAKFEIDGDPVLGTISCFEARALPKANRLVVDASSRLI